MISRVLLYGLVVLVLLGFGWGWFVLHNRGLQARLDSLDLVAATDGDGTLLLEVLDREFQGPFLSEAVTRGALRARAIALLKAGRFDDALAAIDEALAGCDDPVERYAMAIERAQALLAADRAPDALAVLEESPPSSASRVLSVWRDLSRAQALMLTERRDEAARLLGETLAALPAPLPPDGAVTVALTRWEVPDLLLFTTMSYGDLAPEAGISEQDVIQAWVHLGLALPDHVPTALEAARRLQALGALEMASEALARAKRLDPDEVSRALEAAPEMESLSNSEDPGLKTRTAPGR